MAVECKFTLTGEIKDFGRIDNAYSSIKTQVEKLLKNWTIEVEVNYAENAGTGELPV